MTASAEDRTQPKLCIDAPGDRRVGRDIAKWTTWQRVAPDGVFGLGAVVPDHKNPEAAFREQRAAHEVAMSGSNEDDVVRVGDHE